MEEIFSEIPEDAKSRAKFMFEMAMRQPDIIKMINILNTYLESCVNEEERNFADFYFNTQLERLQDA